MGEYGSIAPSGVPGTAPMTGPQESRHRHHYGYAFIDIAAFVFAEEDTAFAALALSRGEPATVRSDTSDTLVEDVSASSHISGSPWLFGDVDSRRKHGAGEATTYQMNACGQRYWRCAGQSH